LPKVSWSRPNNSTHGIIECIIDTSVGPTPFDVKAYYAKTLDNKRFVEIIQILIHFMKKF